MVNRILYLLLMVTLPLTAADSFISPYHDNSELNQALGNLNHNFLKKSVLTTTRDGHKIHLLKLTSSDERKPAILIVGDTNSNSPVGCEVILLWLKKILDQETTLENLLKHHNIYIIPRPAPDALKSTFGPKTSDSRTNNRPTDDDKDQAIDEDPTEDLNKDGFITLLRVKDEDGTYEEHKECQQIMVKGEKGGYKIFSEGIDNDKDKLLNEDGPGGVDFNRNFTFKYPYFKKDAGPHQISEPETRALADFAFQHPEIFLVLSFGKENNMARPWKESSKPKASKIREEILKEDEKLLGKYSSLYKKIFKPGKFTEKANSQGSFCHWAYFHYGRLSISINPWWIPLPQKNELKDKREAEAVQKALWLKKHRPDALLSWQKVEHPDFPGKVAEVGGIKNYYDFVPDYKTCKNAAENLSQFIGQIIKIRPILKIKEAKLIQLGDRIYRYSIKVKNEGDRSTISKIGEMTKKGYPLNIELKIPKKTVFYKGFQRSRIQNIPPGEIREMDWLLIFEPQAKKEVDLSIDSPQVNGISTTTGVSK